MDITDLWTELATPGGRILYLILDGLGGLPSPSTERTALHTAESLSFDDLARDSSCGLLEIVGPGITPGSGPGHLALFGYAPCAGASAAACCQRWASTSRYRPATSPRG